jgi:hypothetical protein
MTDDGDEQDDTPNEPSRHTHQHPYVIRTVTMNGRSELVRKITRMLAVSHYHMAELYRPIALLRDLRTWERWWDSQGDKEESQCARESRSKYVKVASIVVTRSGNATIHRYQ